MTEFNHDKPHGTVVGHPLARYEQNGVLFDGQYRALKRAPDSKERIIHHDKVESSRVFLLNILKAGPLSKSAVYKAAEDNNQTWENVRDAATLLNIVKFQYNKMETWKLPEEVPEI